MNLPMPLETEIEALNRLTSDPRLADLKNYVPSLSLLHMFGKVGDELAHSGMLAALLDPRQHRNYERILRPLLQDVSHGLAQAESSEADIVHQVAEAPLNRVAVRRELYHIDIVVEVDSPAGEIVLGVENKIAVTEQPGQLARYQRALLRAYPDRLAVIVFLCPVVRKPVTASHNSDVPVVPIGYRSVINAIKSALDVTEPNSRDWWALAEIVRHLEEDILSSMNDMDLHRMVGQLWKDHGPALNLAFSHRPGLADVQEKYEELPREHLGEDAEFSYYPTQGVLREIKMQLTSWKKRGFPFLFMFYLGRISGVPRVRLLLWGDSYTAHRDQLEEWAKRVNGSEGNMVDETFASLPSWTRWRRVLQEEDYPENSTLYEQSFDEATALEAAQRILALVDLIRTHVEGFDQ